MKTSGAATGPFSRVPLEIIEEVLQFIPRPTLLSLCQVSKQFNLPTTRLVYRDLNLSSPSTVVRCCRTLASNPAAAAAVKSLIISFSSSPGPLLRPFYKLLETAFRNLSQVLDLELLFQDLYLPSVLATCTFPRLHRFECLLPFSAVLATFLNRHTTINYLQISPPDHIHAGESTDRPQGILILPKLEYLIGNHECVSALVQGSALRAACIEWTTMGQQPVRECIAALEQSSSDSLRVLSCRRAGWNLDLIDVVSTHLPDILVLSITNVLLVDLLPNEGTFEAMGKYLPRFSSLLRLLIQDAHDWEFGRPPCLMDRDFAVVRAWGSACPSLVECTLPHGLKWRRVRENIWFPDPAHRKGTEWLFDKIYSRKFPELEHLIDVMEQVVRERAGDLAEFEEAIARLKTLRRHSHEDRGEEEGDLQGGEEEEEAEEEEDQSEEDDG